MSTSAARYRLHGGMGSPYSLKMRAILRYRRIDHDWVLITRDSPVRAKHGGANVIPVLEFPDGTAMVDSTPILFELEKRYAERSLVPDDETHAFLALLIEDMADEWFTKVMFHYRWYRSVDQEYAAAQIIADNAPGLSGDAFAASVRAIRERQVSRMALVGCTPTNAPLIEATYLRVLDALQKISLRDNYIFGTRPSLADFGIYGQFRVLAEDHTPHAIVRARNPRVYDWLRRLDDASGIEGEWQRTDNASTALHDLLAIADDSYLPFLAANEQALRDGVAELTLKLNGYDFVQAPFRYQSKCLGLLRSRYAALSSAAKAKLSTLLRADSIAVLARS